MWVNEGIDTSGLEKRQRHSTEEHYSVVDSFQMSSFPSNLTMDLFGGLQPKAMSCRRFA